MFKMFKRNIIVVVLVLSLVYVNPVFSDIYMYIDSKGVVHFTNAPTSNDYKL